MTASPPARGGLLALILLLGVGAAGCSEPALSPVEEVTVQVASLGSEPGDRIPFAIVNRTERRLRYPFCGSLPTTIFVDRNTTSGWQEEFSSEGCDPSLSTGVGALAPGDSLRRILIVDEAGVYRLRFRYGFSEAAPRSRTAVSRHFTVQVR